MKKWLSNILVKYLIKKSVVLSNQKIGESFQLLTIKLSEKKEWIPGQKIQIKVTDQELRSYTPTKWEKDQRTFETLIYNHGNGPGALWSASAKPSMPVQVVGPRNSLDIREIDGSLFFFGDETTYGLAYALKEAHSHKIGCFFEASKTLDAAKALEFLNLDQTNLFERDKDNSHLQACLERIISAYRDETIILSGKKDSIDFLQNALLIQGVLPEKIVKKRYWGWKKAESVV